MKPTLFKKVFPRQCWESRPEWYFYKVSENTQPSCYWLLFLCFGQTEEKDQLLQCGHIDPPLRAKAPSIEETKICI